MLGPVDPTPPQKSRPSQQYRTLAGAEARFAGLVHEFLQSYPAAQRPFASRIAKSWSIAWSHLLDQAPPPEHLGAFESLQAELLRAGWRSWYSDPAHRERILQRRRQRYRERQRRQRKERQQQTDAQVSRERQFPKKR